MIYCYGDSITKGTPGLSYTKYIKNKKIKNFGLGGDTLQGLIKRVYLTIDKRPTDHYIIQIGTNDVLLRFLKNHSNSWRMTVNRLVKRGRFLCDDAQHFYCLYKDFVEGLLNKEKQVTLITIPCLGENVDSPLNQIVNQYNTKILTIARDHAVDLIDFNAWQKNILKSNPSVSAYFISRNPFHMVLDSLLTLCPVFSKYLSKKRGLLTTVDGCHLNKVGAEGLAKLLSFKKVTTGTV